MKANKCYPHDQLAYNGIHIENETIWGQYNHLTKMMILLDIKIRLKMMKLLDMIIRLTLMKLLDIKIRLK